MNPFKKIQSNLNTYYTKFKGTPHRNYPCDTKNGLSNVQPLPIKDD